MQEEEKNLKEYSKEEIKNDDYILKMEEKLNKDRINSANLKESITGLKVKKAKISENILSGKRELSRLEQEIKFIDIKNQSIGEEINLSKEAIGKNKTCIYSSEKEVKDLKQHMAKLQETIEESHVKTMELKQR